MVDIHVTDNRPFINQTAEESVTQRNLWNRLEIQNLHLQPAWPILKLIMGGLLDNVDGSKTSSEWQTHNEHRAETKQHRHRWLLFI